MSYCAIEDAFTPLVAPGAPSSKKSKKNRMVPVPTAPSNSDQETKEVSLAEQRDVDVDRQVPRLPPANDILSSPASNSRLDSMESSSSDFFPMQGNNAEPEAWQKAFLLGDMSSSVQKPSFPVEGQPTLWRSIPKTVAVAASSADVGAPFLESSVQAPDELTRRLDSLTRQLNSLTSPTPMQSTAELFLFVAIGLLLLLAIDTLLRYATAARSYAAQASLQVMSGGSRKWSIGRRR
jgi:hypothetical protein